MIYICIVLDSILIYYTSSIFYYLYLSKEYFFQVGKNLLIIPYLLLIIFTY
jgi:hypothetical protein